MGIPVDMPGCIHITLLGESTMRIKRYNNTVKLWLSANDTYDWANKPGASWPCSELAGHRLFAEFDNGDLIDYAVDGKDHVMVLADEFTAMTDDFLAE